MQTTLDQLVAMARALDDINSRLLSPNGTWSLRVSTWINLFAREEGQFDVRFSDQLWNIPEPAAGVITFPAALVVLARRRRRSPLRLPLRRAVVA